MLTKNKFFSLYFVAAYLFLAPAYAQQLTGIWFAAGGDFFWLNQPSTKTINMGGTQPPIPDYYYPHRIGQVASYDISIGYQFTECWEYPISYRVALLYQSDFNSKTHGKVRNADEVDYLYSYANTSRVLFLQLQLDLYVNQIATPYLDLAIGAARNALADYGEQTLPGQIARVSPQFLTRSVVTPAYRFGVGLMSQFHISSNEFQASIAYLFANLNEAESGSSNYYTHIAGQRLNQRLSGPQLELMVRYYIE